MSGSLLLVASPESFIVVAVSEAHKTIEFLILTFP